MEPTELKIEISDDEAVTGLLYSASKAQRLGITVVLGHGAGADQLSGFMRMFASGLAARGIDAVTFNFLYKEKGRSVPDPKARLESCYQSVIDAARKHKKLKTNRLVIGGKSMGGRIASQVAAANGDGISGLVFFGYPLHPPGRPDKMRDEHLKDIRAPMLFCQGSRDPFGSPDEIRAALKIKSTTGRRPVDKTARDKLAACRTTVFEVSGGDHSFKVPKSAGVPQHEVYEKVMDEVAAWTRAL